MRSLSFTRRALMRHGRYDHTPDELAFGAKVAWRNHAGCIGRLFWDSLLVRDRRDVSEPEAIFDDLCGHLQKAAGDGASGRSSRSTRPRSPESGPATWKAGNWSGTRATLMAKVG